MFAFQIRQAAEAAPRDQLPDVSKALWAAYAAGSVSEAEAEALSTLIEARKTPVASPAAPNLRKPVGSRPRTSASLERRRRWAASGRLSPAIAAQFTTGEQAALSVITLEQTKRGDCRLALDHIAAVAGVSRTTVRNAIKQARALGLVTVRERRVSRFRSETNVVTIISREWLAWMRLSRAVTGPGGGRKFAKGTNTHDPEKSCQPVSKRILKAFEMGNCKTLRERVTC